MCENGLIIFKREPLWFCVRIFEFGKSIESNIFLLQDWPEKLLMQVQKYVKLAVWLHEPPFKQGELQQAFF